MTTAPLIVLSQLSRSREESGLCPRVKVDTLHLAPGEVLTLTGEAGSGKNLLLRLLGLLLPPDSGEILFDGQPTAQFTEDARAEFRSRRCGYLYESPFLLPSFSTAENIAMPLFKLTQLSPEAARERTERVLNFVGLELDLPQRELSRRQQHHVALARALAHAPQALFAEELEKFLPPAELPDFRELLHRAAREFSLAVVLSASPALPPLEGERRLEIADGRLVCEVKP